MSPVEEKEQTHSVQEASKLANVHVRVIEGSGQSDDHVPSTHEKPRKHGKKEKREKMEVDYRLKGEYWPGLLLVYTRSSRWSMALLTTR